MIENHNELKQISQALKNLREKKVIRTNNLVGDLGEYYCQQYFGIELCDLLEKGYDGLDGDKRVEIKTRRDPVPSAKVTFSCFDFDYCIFVELNEDFEPIEFRRIELDELKKNLQKSGNSLSVTRLREIGKKIM